MSTNPSITRRHFLASSAFAAAGATLAGCKSTPTRSPNEKLNLGFIGAGGRAAENIDKLTGENIVALCDVDDKNAAAAFKKFPDARRFRDFRKMLEQEKSLDAIV